MSPLVAHVKWFVDEQSVLARPFQGLELWAVIGIVIAGLSIGYLVHKYFRPFDVRLNKYFARF